jgi:DNA-binding NarL/FixJ family response regulator
MSSTIEAPATILFIESDQATLQLYARDVGKIWHVVDVASFTEAFDQLESTATDVIVMEPYGSTEEAWAFLRMTQTARFRQVPVVVCSVLDERRVAYALGAAAYLLKPVSPHQLVQEIRRVLSTRQLAMGKE